MRENYPKADLAPIWAAADFVMNFPVRPRFEPVCAGCETPRLA